MFIYEGEMGGKCHENFIEKKEKYAHLKVGIEIMLRGNYNLCNIAD
jgi:hypothetical protein